MTGPSVLHLWGQVSQQAVRKRETASPGSDVLAGASNGTWTATLMTKRKEMEEEEVACWDLGHSSVSLSLRGCQKQNQASVQSSLSLQPQFSCMLRYRRTHYGRSHACAEMSGGLVRKGVTLRIHARQRWDDVKWHAKWKLSSKACQQEVFQLYGR